jgi:hypothetical protein
MLAPDPAQRFVAQRQGGETGEADWRAEPGSYPSIRLFARALAISGVERSDKK